jgi:hypothetical protein
MFPVMYELGFYIPEDGTLHSQRRENLKVHFRCIQVGSDCTTVLKLRGLLSETPDGGVVS